MKPLKFSGIDTNWVKYTVFKTKWGYFGIAGTDGILWRTHLPEENTGSAENGLLEEIRTVWGDILRHDKTFMKPLQEQIITYFEGQRVSFDPNLTVLLNEFSPFTQSVLNACRGITLGQTTSSMIWRIGWVTRAQRGPLVMPWHEIHCR